jgi:hypothetical protein
MALLASLGRARSSKWVAAAAVLATMTGCVLYDAFLGGEKRFAFGHREHVVEQGLACEDCHAPDDAGEPKVPTLAQCNLCHAELDASKPLERRIDMLFEGQKMRLSHASALPDEVRFAHASHAAQGLECTACHADLESNDDVLDIAPQRMRDCTSCHSERKAANECSTCHTLLREDVAPGSHGKLWLRQHGPVACSGSDRTMDDCQACHQESDCTTCHLTQAPESHTDYWRHRAHGIVAALDRASCATCHRDDSCVRCHGESRPISHTGNWGAPLDRHCVGCHFPVENEGCVVCHEGTPSHALATPKPPDHTPGMNCRMCHGAGQPLPHVDNGDNCNICHL